MKNSKTYTDLIAQVTQYLPPADVALIEKAYTYAKEAHRGQTRKSGDEYISHPVEVAYILAELEQDASSVCAGLLHDTLEDTTLSPDTLTEVFGDHIRQLIEGVTKLGKIYFDSKEEQQAENFRKMFIAMAKDIRVVIIKLADRLHNMRTLKHLAIEKRSVIAKETRDIFAPLAHRLGMWSVKWELEDLCFYHLQYEEFQEIKKLVALRREERENYVDRFITRIKALLEENQLPGKVAGRPKHFYSIYKKLLSQDLNFDELYDTLGIRVILSSIRECYEMLGLVHAAFKPINGRFKDYIAMPKSNLYQSLHTTVIGPEGKPIEVQIRTAEMHQIAEYGIAAHWRYKEGGTQKFDADFSWLRQILENEEKSAAKEFLQNLKVDLFIDEVFVFTPKGAVHVLPKGATPVDFAYRIHTEIGHCCVGAKINGHIVPLYHKLQSGDRVEILTSKKANPNIDWLHFVHTAQAKTKIKQWHKKEHAQDNIQKGKLKLDKVLLVSGYIPKEVLSKDILDKILHHFSLTSLDDLYLMVSHGDISAKDVVSVLDTLTQKPLAEPDIKVSAKKTYAESSHDIMVLGEPNVMASLAKCCNPLPGDPILGYITLGYGVSVHRGDCPQVLHMDDAHKARLVSTEWGNTQKKLYTALLQVEAFDRIGILKDILNSISETKTNIVEVKTKSSAKGGSMRAAIVVEIKDLKQLQTVKQAIAMVADVLSVRRGKE